MLEYLIWAALYLLGYTFTYALLLRANNPDAKFLSVIWPATLAALAIGLIFIGVHYAYHRFNKFIEDAVARRKPRQDL